MDHEVFHMLPKVELAMAYGCHVSQEQLLQYIRYNRHHNTMLIEHNVKLTNELKTGMENFWADLLLLG